MAIVETMPAVWLKLEASMAWSVAFHTQPSIAAPLAVPTTILMPDQATPATDGKG